jgi:hypothetical protein
MDPDLGRNRPVDFKYEGPPPNHNLLDYRYMTIEMNRWADTAEAGCASYLLVLGAGVLCFVLIALAGILVAAN